MTLQERVLHLITQHGGVRAAARALNMDAGYLTRMAQGRRTRPSERTLRALGLRLVKTYELTEGTDNAQPPSGRS